jgi:c(7)-type cytochrome triheme protein
MRHLIAYPILFALVSLTGMLAQEKKAAAPPSKLVFEAKNGKVTYDHTAHAKREKNDCKVCHPAVFPQDAKAPLNFKGAMHKTAEEKKVSCAHCHYEGGKAFATKGNCANGKCHNNDKAAAPKKG